MTSTVGTTSRYPRAPQSAPDPPGGGRTGRPRRTSRLLSMRRLGQQLGVEAMALYRHVGNKEELLDGMVDVVVAEIDPPTTGPDWKSVMRTRILSARAALLRHRWASEVIVSRRERVANDARLHGLHGRHPARRRVLGRSDPPRACMCSAAESWASSRSSTTTRTVGPIDPASMEQMRGADGGPVPAHRGDHRRRSATTRARSWAQAATTTGSSSSAST